jgi:hypothetical protein
LIVKSRVFSIIIGGEEMKSIILTWLLCGLSAVSIAGEQFAVCSARGLTNDSTNVGIYSRVFNVPESSKNFENTIPTIEIEFKNYLLAHMEYGPRIVATCLAFSTRHDASNWLDDNIEVSRSDNAEVIEVGFAYSEDRNSSYLPDGP